MGGGGGGDREEGAVGKGNKPREKQKRGNGEIPDSKQATICGIYFEYSDFPGLHYLPLSVPSHKHIVVQNSVLEWKGSGSHGLQDQPSDVGMGPQTNPSTKENIRIFTGRGRVHANKLS